MTWTRLSDDFNDRPEHLRLSRSARLLHIEALVYCNRHLLNGSLPAAALPRLTDSEDVAADIEELAAVGLWQADGRDWLIDWTNQEDAEDVRARQQYQAEKQKRYRDRRARHQRGDHSTCDPRFCKQAVTGNAPSNETGGVTPSRPVPSRPKDRGQGRGAAGSAGATPTDPVEAEVAYPPDDWHAFEPDGSTLTCDRCHLSRQHPRHATHAFRPVDDDEECCHWCGTSPAHEIHAAEAARDTATQWPRIHDAEVA